MPKTLAGNDNLQQLPALRFGKQTGMTTQNLGEWTSFIFINYSIDCVQVGFAQVRTLVQTFEFKTTSLSSNAAIYYGSGKMTVLACIAVAVLTLTIVSRRTDN